MTDPDRLAQSLLDEGHAEEALPQLLADTPAELLPLAIETVRSWPDPATRVDLMIGLSKAVPEDQRGHLIDEAAATATQIDIEEPHDRALIALLGVLPDEKVPDALAEALTLNSQFWAFEAISATSERLAGPLSAETWAAIRRLPPGDARDLAQRRFLRDYIVGETRWGEPGQQVPFRADAIDALLEAGTAEDLDVVTDLARGADESILATLIGRAAAEPSARSLAAIAPALGESLVIEAVEIGVTFGDPGRQVEWLSTLGSGLSEDMLGVALARAKRLEDADERRRVIAALVQELDEEMLTAALGRAGEGDADDWTLAIEELGPKLPADALQPALSLVRRATDPARRAPALAALGRRLPGQATEIAAEIRSSGAPNADAAAASVTETARRLQELESSVRDLPPSAFRDAFVEAAREGTPDAWIDTLGLTNQLGSQVASFEAPPATVLEAARLVADPERRSAALAAAAAMQEGDQRVAVANEALEAARLAGARPYRFAVTSLAPFLPPARNVELLDVLREHPERQGEQYLLADVLPYLPDEVERSVRREIERLWHDQGGRGADDAVEIVLQLSADERAEVLRRLLSELGPQPVSANGGDDNHEPEPIVPVETSHPGTGGQGAAEGGGAGPGGVIGTIRDSVTGLWRPRLRGERPRDVEMSAPPDDDGPRRPEPAHAEPPVHAEPPEHTGQPAPRWLSAVVNDEAGTKLEKAFRANAVNRVTVDIGPLRQDRPLTAVGPESLDATLTAGEAHDLVIVFQIPELGTVSAQRVSLPPTGTSRPPAVFTFTAPAQGTTVTAAISALYQNRVLQTAELRGITFDDPAAAPAGFAIEFKLAAVRPGLADLDFRGEFDAAVLAGHGSDGAPAATAVAGTNIARFKNPRLSKATEKLIGILTDLADHPDQFASGLDAPAAVELIRSLAYQGQGLHDVLGSGILAQLPGVELSRLQVVSAPEDFIPVEFIYDLPVPALEAGLCPNWRAALIDGKCDPANHPVNRRKEASVVCPTGFWAVTKVVERQVISEATSAPDLEGADFAVVSGPSPSRPHLRAFAPALFAASSKVAQEHADAVLETLSNTTGGKSARVTTWDDWLERIENDEPALLVLLSHSAPVQETIALEIEKAERFLINSIDHSFVRAEGAQPPVVLLLGCETATADKHLQSFVGRIKSKGGAALVVGTITPVLGRHAAPVAQALIRGLHDAAAEAAGDENAAGDAAPGTFGDVMLRLRRKLLADGHLMALCLTSFGDADWRLAAPSTP